MKRSTILAILLFCFLQSGISKAGGGQLWLLEQRLSQMMDQRRQDYQRNHYQEVIRDLRVLSQARPFSVSQSELIRLMGRIEQIETVSIGTGGIMFFIDVDHILRSVYGRGSEDRSADSLIQNLRSDFANITREEQRFVTEISELTLQVLSAQFESLFPLGKSHDFHLAVRTLRLLHKLFEDSVFMESHQWENFYLIQREIINRVAPQLQNADDLLMLLDYPIRQMTKEARIQQDLISPYWERVVELGDPHLDWIDRIQHAGVVAATDRVSPLDALKRLKDLLKRKRNGEVATLSIRSLLLAKKDLQIAYEYLRPLIELRHIYQQVLALDQEAIEQLDSTTVRSYNDLIASHFKMPRRQLTLHEKNEIKSFARTIRRMAIVLLVRWSQQGYSTWITPQAHSEFRRILRREGFEMKLDQRPDAEKNHYFIVRSPQSFRERCEHLLERLGLSSDDETSLN